MQRIKSRDVVADFFAQGYRVSGAFRVTTRMLSDVVYDTNTGYLTLTDAYLSPITDPATIGAHYHAATLDKSSLDFVLVLDRGDGLRRDQRYSLGNHMFDVCLTVPFFEIRGRLPSANRSFDARAFLTREAGTFITLVDVTARCTFSPDITYRGGAALVARNSIGFLGEQESRGD